MINSLCGTLGSHLAGGETPSPSSSSQAPQQQPRSSSPTPSASESNALVAAADAADPPSSSAIAFPDADAFLEVQSPGSSIWEALFADQLDDSACTGDANAADFMLWSPRREFMISSPRRDGKDFMVSSPRKDGGTDFMVSSPRRSSYMVSSPVREYMMISSPKREYMVSSPKREYYMMSSPKRDVMHQNHHTAVIVSSPTRGGAHSSTSYFAHSYDYLYAPPSSSYTPMADGVGGKGKSPSPLHRMASTTSTDVVNQGESRTVLPAIEELLDNYLKENLAENAYVPSSTAKAEEEDEEGGIDPALLECLQAPTESPPSPKRAWGSSAGVLLPPDEEGDDDLYRQIEGFGGRVPVKPSSGHHHHQQQQQQAQEELDYSLISVISKSEQFEASYLGLLGSVASDPDQEQDNGLQLVHQLLACAEAMAKDDHVTARRYLHHLKTAISPLGHSMQRVAACFTDALSARLASMTSTPTTTTSPSSSSSSSSSIYHHHYDVHKLYQILYQACPYIKFAHFVANQAIFESFESEDRVHVIDLDILQGYQWPSLMQALASRPSGPPSLLRITGVGPDPELVRQTGRHLADLAQSLRLPFEFHPIGERLEDVRPSMLHRRVGEALAVNAVNRLHRVPANHQGSILSMVRDQAPCVVTVVEQEASHDGTHFLGRFLEALHYYSAIFDSLDATFPADSEERARVERMLLGEEIRNIVACEGEERVERHERMERWRRIMEGKGFRGVPFSDNAVAQSRVLLGLYSADGYRLMEDSGCLLLGWQDRPIVAASAWRC